MVLPRAQAEQGYSLAQKATLLAAFFPVFIPMQLVATWAIQRFGAKRISTIENSGIAVSLLAAPAAMALGGPLGLAACFTLLGVFQAPLFPAISVMKKQWTAGVEPAHKAMLLRIMSVGGHIGGVSTAWLVPKLASRFGWRSVPYFYGALMAAMAAVWHTCAESEPPEDSTQQQPEQQAEKGAEKKAPPLDWRVFRVRSVQVCLFNHCESSLSLLTRHTSARLMPVRLTA